MGGVGGLHIWKGFAAEKMSDEYDDDVRAETDMNVVMTGSGLYVEVQGTAEGEPFDRRMLDQLLDLAAAGCADLTLQQRAALNP